MVRRSIAVWERNFLSEGIKNFPYVRTTHLARFRNLYLNFLENAKLLKTTILLNLHLRLEIRRQTDTNLKLTQTGNPPSGYVLRLDKTRILNLTHVHNESKLIGKDSGGQNEMYCMSNYSTLYTQETEYYINPDDLPDDLLGEMTCFAYES